MANSKLNSVFNIISIVLKNNGISHEDFKTITNEERNQREPKGGIRMIEIQRSIIERWHISGI